VAAAYYLRLAFVTAQRPEDEEDRARVALPQIGIAVGAALLFTVGATLSMGIIPGNVLEAAQAAAHTLRVPPASDQPAQLSLPQPPRP
jgi:NADH-quinone oxidoreductase subunit N